MRSEELAASVPAITREYISLAILEALQPAIEEIFTEISKVKSMASQKPDNSNLASEIAQTVEASISSGIANIINQRTATFRQELDDVLAQIQAETAKTEASSASLMSAVADLDARMRKWIAEDRYDLTRAQVIKIMRDHNG